MTTPPYSCKLCAAPADVNSRYARALGLRGTATKVVTCRDCACSHLIGEIPTGLYDEKYFSAIGAEYSYDSQSLANVPHYRAIIAKLQQLNPHGERLLDIGCGPGHFLAEAEKYISTLYGTDVSIPVGQFIAKKSKLLDVDFNDLVLEPSSFDYITLNHSLEHVRDPRTLLAKVASGLEIGGILYVEVPYQFRSIYDLIVNRVSPKQEPDVFSFHHLTFFTPRGLRKLLHEQGFTLVSLETHLPLRSQGRFAGLRGRVLQLLLKVSNWLNRGDYIAVYAKRE